MKEQCSAEMRSCDTHDVITIRHFVAFYGASKHLTLKMGVRKRNAMRYGGSAAPSGRFTAPQSI